MVFFCIVFSRTFAENKIYYGKDSKKTDGINWEHATS
jgi:hypothetical protein